MNRRAARRHPPAQQKAARGQAHVIPRAGGSAARRAAAPSRGIRGLLYPEWLRNVASELRKVIWPTREETQNLTVVVIVVAVAVGIVLGILDFVFSWLVERTLF